LAALGAALLVATLAVGLIPDEAPSADETDPGTASSEAEDRDHEANGSSATTLAHQPRHDHALSDREGEVPSRAQASELPHHFEEFVVRGDDGLVEMAEKGYITGNGTLSNPYVIDGFRVDEELTIEDTSRPLVVENSYIDGQLTLNFVGEEVYVHHNHVRDLRVNENVEREGPTTAGLFEHNEIDYIGQIRHFGGTFQHNDVGPRPDGVVETYLSDTGPAELDEDVVWNFDGYHGAHVHNNTVEGRVDVKLHGHFHGSCSACPAHAHQDPEDFPADTIEGGEPRSRHSYRYHVLDVENNTIEVEGADRALRFYDEAHAGDDQTADSEPNPYLEDKHEHHAYLRVHGNDIDGGSLAFDVVNAENDRHEGLTQEARIDLTGNHLTRPAPRGAGLVPAFEAETADHATLHAEGNRFAFQRPSSPAPEGYGWVDGGDPADTTAFLFEDVNASRVQIQATEGANATYGVTLDDVRDNTPVVLEANRFDAREEDRRER
jgi:hypothetical protein